MIIICEIGLKPGKGHRWTKAAKYARATKTSYHKLNGFSNKNIFSQNSGSQKSKMKALAELSPSENWDKK